MADASPQPEPLPEEQFQAIARALADPRRFAILRQIAEAAQTPCAAVTERHPVSPATISHHLKELGDAGLVTAERQGRCMILTLHRPTWDAYLARLSAL